MKKRKLLREDILPAMASNRKVQRLLNEFMDLLSEYESTETNVDQVDPALLKVWLDLEHVLHRDTSRAATTNWWWSSCTWTLEWQKHRTILNFVSILKYIYHYWCVEKGSHLSTRLWFGALHFYVPKIHIVSRNVFKYTPFPPFSSPLINCATCQVIVEQEIMLKHLIWIFLCVDEGWRSRGGLGKPK